MSEFATDEPGTQPEEVAPLPDAPRESLGMRLRNARTAQGLSLETLSAQLKITPRKITAIEDERYSELPAGPYRRGIIRNYAKALGLDPAAAAEAFEREVGPTPAALDLTLRPSLRTPFPQRPSGSNDSGLGRFMVTATVALLLVAAAIAWSGTASFRTTTAMLYSLAGNRTSARVPHLVLGAKAIPTAVDKLRNPRSADEMAGQNPGVGPVVVSQTLPAAPLAPVSTALASTDTVVPDPSSAHTSDAAVGSAASAALVLHFADASWVEIKQADGKVLVSQQVPSGSQKSIEGSPPFEIIIGNAPSTVLEYRGSTVDLAPYTHDRVARLTLR